VSRRVNRRAFVVSATSQSLEKIATPSIAEKSAPTAAAHTSDQGYAKRVANILQNLAEKATAHVNVPLAGRANKTRALTN
jgi:hypothetical protein